MIKVNEYFDGNVKSMVIDNEEGHSTVGIMLPGEYEFGTSTIEYITVISGEMTVQIPGETKWRSFEPFQTFMVPKDSKFKLKLKEASAYKCIYK